MAVIARLRPQLANITGLRIFLSPVQDVRSGGRASNSTYQYTLKGENSADLREWSRKLMDELKTHPELTDIDSDQQENGVETNVNVDPTAAARLGIRANAVDASLYDAFGQRQVATIYTELNQYHVVMEWAPEYTQSPNALADVYVPGTSLVNNGGHVVATERAATSSVNVAQQDGEHDAACVCRSRRTRRCATRRAATCSAIRRRASFRSRRSRRSSSSPRRRPSTTRIPSSRPRSRSTLPRARRSTTHARRSRRRRPTSACRRACAAASPVRHCSHSSRALSNGC